MVPLQPMYENLSYLSYVQSLTVRRSLYICDDVCLLVAGQTYRFSPVHTSAIISESQGPCQSLMLGKLRGRGIAKS